MQRTQARPVVTLGDVLREMRQIALPALAGFLLAFGQYTLLAFTIPMLHTNGGLSVALAGIVLAMAQLGGATARIGLGIISDRLGGRLDVTLLGASVTGSVLAVVVAVLPARQLLAVQILLWLALGMAMVGWNALLITWAGERVQVHHTGAAVGLTTSCVLCGAIVSAPLMGFIIQTTKTYSAAWLALAGILALATGVVWWGFHRRHAARAIHEAPMVAE
jgi:ACS family hexuronate transporter-like MFS transporter